MTETTSAPSDPYAAGARETTEGTVYTVTGGDWDAVVDGAAVVTVVGAPAAMLDFGDGRTASTTMAMSTATARIAAAMISHGGPS